MRRPQCNAFYHISACKSTYGQDRTIALIHMLNANKSECFDVYFSMSAMVLVQHSIACITLRTRA